MSSRIVHLWNYCACLQLLSTVATHPFECLYPPKMLMEFVYDKVYQETRSKWPKKCLTLFDHVLKYKILATDIIQASILQGGCSGMLTLMYENSRA